MRLRDKLLEKSVRTRVRDLLRADRPQWREYKRRRWRWSQALPSWPLSLVLRAVLVAAIIACICSDSGSLARVAAVLAMYATAGICFGALWLRALLVTSVDAMVMRNLPVADLQFAHRQWSRWLRSFLWPLGVYAIVFGYVAHHYGSDYKSWACSLAVALLLWLTEVSLATWLATMAHGCGFTAFGAALWAIMITVLVKGGTSEVIGIGFETFPILLGPTGWVVRAFEKGVFQARLYELSWLLPGLALSLSLSVAYRHVVVRYWLCEPDEAEPSPEEELAAAGDADGQLAAKSAEESLAAGTFLQEQDWRSIGFIERIVTCALSRRERRICGFMVGEPMWTAGWRIAVFASLVGLALVWAASFVPTWVGTVAFVFAVLQALPTFGVAQGFGGISSGDRHLPMFAGFPVGYWEVSWAVLKVNTVRTVAWAAVGVPLAALLALRLDVAPLTGALNML